MMYEPFRNPGDFDDNGLLKAPVIFWVGLVVLARAWWLAGLMPLIAPTSNTHDGVLWPDIRFQLVALAAGIPGMVMLFIYPLRERWPGLSRFIYVLILAALVMMLVTDLTGLMSEEMWDVGWLFICLDIACFVMLWPDRWLRMVFLEIPGGSHLVTKADTSRR
ncbi:DUF2919 domain-containing protein [Salmonella enterica subsp. enterica serovar Oslo]|nr:DUF2919 domain-containing protein [Salmonella enterica subsp. enterica serovar Oslo]